MKLYEIDEKAAARAKEMTSLGEYVYGTATREYKIQCEKALLMAEHQKEKVDSIHHERIDTELDRYCRRLADAINEGYRIDASSPSVMVAGPDGMDPARQAKKEAAMERHMEKMRDVQEILEGISSIGMGGISSGDPEALPKLRQKLAGLEAQQAKMKQVNAYWRKHGKLDGCPGLTDSEKAALQAALSRSWEEKPVPYEAFMLANNNGEIHRLRKRIFTLEQLAETDIPGWVFPGGEVIINKDLGRVQIRFDEKPEEEKRAELCRAAFHWSGKEGCWQRLLTQNAIRAAKSLAFLKGE
jgi:hypothetical protein